jgi:hypothetical protein
VIRVEVCEEEHVNFLIKSDKSGSLGRFIQPQHVHIVCNSNNGIAYTVFDGEEVLFCGGVIEFWKNRGEVWGIFNAEMSKHQFLAVHRATKRFLEVCPVRRLEAMVETDFVQGHRWIKKLGFEVEAVRLRSYFPNGKDGTMYAKINGV